MENRFEKGAVTEGRAEENQENQKSKYAESPEWEDGVVRRKPGNRKFRLTGSLTVKIIAFFLLAVSCMTGLTAGLLCMYMESQGIYTKDVNSVMLDIMAPDYQYAAYEAISFIEHDNVEAVSEVCGELGVELQLIYVSDAAEEIVIWDSATENKTGFSVDIGFIFEQKGNEVLINGRVMRDGKWYLLRFYIDPQKSALGSRAEKTQYLYRHRYALIAMAAGGITLCLISFLFLICSAGHRNEREGIVPGVLTRIYLDVLTVLFGGVAAAVVLFMVSEFPLSFEIGRFVVMVLSGTFLAVWMTIYFMDIALRVKGGPGWRYSLVYVILRRLGRELAALMRGIPQIFTTLIIYLGICILEFMGVILILKRQERIFLWTVEKVILLFVVLYIALMCRKLLQASRKLADGEEDYRVDTSRMFGAFRKHGENLNSLGMGISKAVEARTKSERLKTELISNVSHDLKTPLTSIINYADLMWEETSSLDDGKIREYAEVLLRQSRRLKKLLEDLVEASKATTGNLEVKLEPCEVGVLLSQAVGEYQQRMEEKKLELIARQPQEGVSVLADGRRLWRVFENLLNNICKYASENSRVYLNVEAKENEVQIIFRNMSKYPLDISAEELAERFVRGDKSRHMEGNGLGLSIARSLVELQNGRMEIVIDGDLFKVILRFPLYSQEQETAVLP